MSTKVHRIEPPQLKQEKKPRILGTKPLTERLREARERPPQRRLIGELITEGEQVILFGDTNVGKSLLAMQIAFAAAKGEGLVFRNAETSIELPNECEPKKVLYLDLEHSDQQIERRLLAPDAEPESLDEIARENIFISMLEAGEDIDGDRPKETFNLIKSEAEAIGSKFIIIDNLSAISGDLEKKENTKRFLKPLSRLCREEGYTILILAHTPKLPSARGVLRTDHLAGSKALPQLVDSVIGMAQQNATDEGHIYIKQLKTRTGSFSYGIGNVLCSKIERVNGMVQHIITHTANELDTISDGNDGEARYNVLKQSALEYLRSGSYRKTAEKMQVSHATIRNRVQRFAKIEPELFKELENQTPEEINTHAIENPTNNTPF